MSLRAQDNPTNKTMLRLVALGLALWLTIAPAHGGEAGRRAARTNQDFGASPDEFSANVITRPQRRVPLEDLIEHKPSRSQKPGTIPLELPRTPVEPAQKLDDVTLDQKLTRRYQDPRVIRVLTEMTSQSGEAFFREISQMIDNRHIEPSSYAVRVNNAFEHLHHAIANPAFQTATGLRVQMADIRDYQRSLSALQQESRVRSQADAVNVIRQVGRMSQQSIGLNPGAVYFEFVYASLDTLDKFSMLLPPEKTGQVNVGLNESLVGIGVEVEADTAGLKILKAFPGGPAAQATLRKGDFITAVDGQSLAGMDLSSAVDLITGRAGTPVKLGLQREAMVAEITLVRRQVEVSSVSEVRMLDDSARVGYIKLDQFAESSAKELDAALWKLHNAGMESLVLDLRGNPGGYLTTAIEISDRFLPSGTIVSTRGRTRDDNTQESATLPNTWKVPLVVLVDHGSASASEILAAAIQENGRGMIVGETSYGKGTVQTLFPLRSVSVGLRLTTAKFYSPDGREMAGEGVSPDIAVRTGSRDDDARMLSAALEAAQDPNLQAMAERMGRPNRTGLRTFEVAGRK